MGEQLRLRLLLTSLPVSRPRARLSVTHEDSRDVEVLKPATLHIEGSRRYGRNGHEDAAADAALIAKLTGKPVRV